LPHLVGARRVSSDLQIVGDQDKSEGIALLQALEQVDNVAFGVLVEVACRFVASSNCGELISARAITTRRCSPPDICPG